MKKILLSTIILLASVMTASAQVTEPKDTPQLEFALQLKVTLGDSYDVGDTQHGQRIVIPITGGTFEGPAIKGTIINGGADYQLANKALNRTELEAIYSIKTDDGVYIHVRNRGIIWSGKDAHKATPLSTSKQPLSLKHQQTVNMPGSIIHSSSAPQTSLNSSKASSSTSGR